MGRRHIGAVPRGALRRLARSRGIVVPSLLADEGGDDAPEAIKVAIGAPPGAVDAGDAA